MTMIADGKPVALSHVIIKAEFELDEHGRPIMAGGRATRTRAGACGRNHYRIRLSVEGVPDDAHAVTYNLHESYRDPVREVLDDPNFPLEITAYGDYEVVVKVRRKRFQETFRASLSSALRATYGSDPNRRISAALADIQGS